MTNLQYHNRENHSSYYGVIRNGRLTIKCTRCTYETTNLDETKVHCVIFIEPKKYDMPALQESR